MTWPSSGCGTTAEFVELLNFGPGPVNIGCYILTTGKYTVTIPPNTIIKPGEFYVLAGQNFIPGSCANVDSASTGITADLNWNACNCTNLPIPTTGNGMMTDGGPGNTPLVLLDADLKVIDAVTRSLPTEAVGPVTSSSVTGGCTGKTFNIDTMKLNYEELGMSQGRGNSFARTMDGDCNWEKDPQQSGNASNNRSGDASDISYDFDMINPTSCGDTAMGSVSIYVKHSNYDAVFPMTYTISLDVNNDGNFGFEDQYETYTDSTAPFIEIENLPVGHFKVTVASAKGCYLMNFEFTIIPCYPNTLPVKLVYFKEAGIKDGQHQLEWLLQDVQNLQSIVVEKAVDKSRFVTDKVFAAEQFRGTRLYSSSLAGTSSVQFVRLKITQKNGQVFYSPVIKIATSPSNQTPRIWPNPATDKIYLDLPGNENKTITYTIYNLNGLAVGKGIFSLNRGEHIGHLSLPALPPGVYNLQVSGRQPISFRFVKH